MRRVSVVGAMLVILLGCGDDTTTSEDETESGDGDGDGDGEPGECDPAKFLGWGIASDGWAVGDFCDWVHICTDEAGVDALLDVGVVCSIGEFGCEPGEVICEIAGSGEVSEETYDEACLALGVAGIDAVWCAVLGG